MVNLDRENTMVSCVWERLCRTEWGQVGRCDRKNGAVNLPGYPVCMTVKIPPVDSSEYQYFVPFDYI